MQVAPSLHRLGNGLINSYLVEESGQVTIIDAGVPGYWLWDAGASWERTDLGWAQRLKVALNVYNLADKKYISTLGSNGFRDYDPSGTFATLLQGAPRQVFFSADVQF